jgi:MFS transporter, BCD family, chlorophyll transporter
MSEQKPGLSSTRINKIGLFHLGSGMADVLMTGVWNRIMISDLGYSATVVGFLAAMRYFLAPLGIWAGKMSDARAIGGYRRLFWIGTGRAMMVISTFILGLATAQLARTPGESTALLWGLTIFAMLLFSIGNAFSGGTFLALIYDRTPQEQRGRVVGIVWTWLLVGFTVGGISFGLMLPATKEGASGLSFTPEALQNLFIIAGLIFATLWATSMWGEERRTTSTGSTQDANATENVSLRSDLRLVWRNTHMRTFLIFLAFSMFFAFSQDAILEPFAGDVFKMPATTTNRFAGYWGSMSILGTLLFLWLSRRYPRLTSTFMSQIGVVLLIIAFAMFGVSSLAEIRPLVTPGLIVLGAGLGVWNVGTLGLMMTLSPTGRAGTFLGFWTMVVTLTRGGGVASGGVVRDLVLNLSGQFSVSYGVVFIVGAVGLIISWLALNQLDLKEYQSEESINAEAVFAASMD